MTQRTSRSLGCNHRIEVARFRGTATLLGFQTLAWIAACLVWHNNLAAQEIPWVDLDHETGFQVVVDREAGQYLGHPTTVLLEDGRTILCVYPGGHGKGPIYYKRSEDGGRTWSDRLATPRSWETSQETPTIHRTIDAQGAKHLILFSGLYPVRLASSDDDGQHWSELAPVGDWGGIVAMSSVIPIHSTPGSYLALFHDDGRFFASKPSSEKGRFTLYASRSNDAGKTWSSPRTLQTSNEVHVCEPGAVFSPDRKQIALLLRENRRVKNSHVMFSDDEGETWTLPKELPDTLIGDRHVAKYLPDGRLFISFRDASRAGKDSVTKGDWVAWVGTYEDLISGRPGQYRIRLKRNYRALDCAYPGVEILPDGTIVTTTYGHWIAGEQPFILCVRFSIETCDSKLGY
ncbi:MAG: sialidase family protein [Planctomycetota bacterium]